MKKVLLATTAAVMSAGVAYAEVTISGNARMGLQYGPNAACDPILPAESCVRFEKRMTVDINATTESSSGITFGAKMRLRSNEAGATITAGARVFMQVSGFEVAMGNIDGAIESMPGLYSASTGLTGLGWGGVLANTGAKGYFNWDSYSSSGNGAEGIEVIYSSGGFTGHLSYSDQEVSSVGGPDRSRVAAYGAYAFGDWTVALGVQDSELDAEDKVGLTVGGNIGDYGVGFGIMDNDGVTKIALNGSATFGATTVMAYVADEDSVVATDTIWGLGVSYDLGGASLEGGISQDEIGDERADFGVSFKF